MICVDCGKEFELVVRVGRPRKRCYECRPARGKAATKPVAKRARTVSDIRQNPHCPWCGAYPNASSDNFPFCNLQHRTLFAEKVQEAADKKRLEQRKGRLGPDRDTMRGGINGRESNGRIARTQQKEQRPAAEAGQSQAAPSGVPAEVANPIDPPRVNGDGTVTIDISAYR